MINFALSLDKFGQPYATLDTATNNLLNAVLLSLHIKRGAWFFNPNFGSRLHEINSTSDLDVALAQEYAKDCLKWIVATNLADKIDVIATALPGGRMEIKITVDGREEFLLPWNVGYVAPAPSAPATPEQPTHQIIITVYSETGEAINNFTVILNGKEITAQDGSAIFETATQGANTLHLSAVGFMSAAYEFSVQDNLEISVIMRRTGALTRLPYSTFDDSPANPIPESDVVNIGIETDGELTRLPYSTFDDSPANPIPESDVVNIGIGIFGALTNI